jgi:hypothetical protein
MNVQKQTEQIQLIYFGESITAIEIYPNGDFDLMGEVLLYHVMPYYIAKARGVFYFSPVGSIDYLNLLAAKIRAVYTTGFSNFIIKNAYSITWFMNISSSLVLYQVILCTDMQFSFMLVSYVNLDLASDTNSSFYIDAELQENTFNASTTKSNSDVPGQFIFQLNTINQFYSQNSLKLKLYNF